MLIEQSTNAPNKIEGFDILECLDPDGPIYLARDATNGKLVTLARLPSIPGFAWASFTRTIEGFSALISTHVARHEGLVQHEEKWFAIEEFIAGDDLETHVKRRAPSDADLLNLFQQVTQGLLALHHAGRPHGQLSLTHIRCVVNAETSTRVVLVSPRLVPPKWLVASAGEQNRTLPNLTFSKADFAEDWQALGKCIQSVLASMRDAEAAESAERTSLTQLAIDLARPAAQALPLREITSRLGMPPYLPGSGLTIFDRPELLSPMRDMFSRVRSGKVAVIALEGAVGLGKTTLMQTFLQECTARGSVVLSATCQELPIHPHGAFWEIIEDLCSYLRHLPPHDLRRILPADMAILGQMFPSLTEIISPYVGIPDKLDVEPRERRSRALAALRRLLAALGAHLPVVMGLDDAHHLDGPAFLLLEQLLDDGCSPVLFVFAVESESSANSGELIRRLLARDWWEGASRVLEVSKLSDEESQRWVSKWCGSFRNTDPEWINRAVRRGRGEPFLLAEMMHGAHFFTENDVASYDNAVEMRLRGLSASAMALLEMLGVAGHPLSQDDFLRIWPNTNINLVIAEAYEQGFLRAGGRRGAGQIDFCHSEIRRLVLSRLSAMQQRDWHERIAESLHAVEASASMLAHHYDSAQKEVQAASYYELAAEQAASVGAHEQAARWYRRVLELRPDFEEAKATAIWEHLADSLWFSGQTIAAGDAWGTLSRRTTGKRSAHFQEKAAHAYLRGGYVDAAVAGLRQVLEQADLPFPESRAAALVRLGFRKTMQAFSSEMPTFMPGKPIDEDLLHRIDLSWAMIGGLGNLDPVLGAFYQNEHLRLARTCGDPLRFSRAIATEAAFLSAEGAQTALAVTRLLDEAKRLVDVQQGGPYWQGILWMMRGEAAFFRGDFRLASEQLEQAEVIFSEHCIGIVWELLATQFYQLYALFYLGRFRELRGKETRARRFARSCGDVHALAMLRSIRVSMALADGDANRALSELAIADQKWAIPELHLHHLIDLRLRSEIDLYLGQVESASLRAQNELRPFLSSMLNQVQFVRVEAIHLRARCVLAAMQTGAEDAQQRKIVEEAIGDLHKESCSWAHALATLLEAGLAARRKDFALASRKLDGAAKQFESLGMSIHETVARRRRSELDMARGTAVPLSVIDRFLTDHHGVRSPARVAAMLAPGF